MKAIFLAVIFLVLQSAQATEAADSPQVELGGNFGLTELGKLPEGWKIIKGGDWAIRLDEQFAPEGSDEAALPLPIVSQHEKECLLPRVLGTDLQGGMIQYDAKEFGDFTFTYQMKHATERDYWNNEFRFRIQNDGQCYMVKRERFGKFSLYSIKGKQTKLVATSDGALQVSQNEWTWVKVQAKGNRFHVFACADGVSFDKYLDYTDPDENAPKKGKIGFQAPVRFRFAFMENPWNNDEVKKNLSAFITRAEQGADFRQAAGSDHTVYTAKIEYFVNDPSSAPRELTLSCNGKNVSAKLPNTARGYHVVQLPVEIGNERAREEIGIILGKDTAKLVLDNVFNFRPAQKSNLGLVKATDFTSSVSKQTYLDCLEKVYANYGYIGNRYSWDARYSDLTILYQVTGDKKYLGAVIQWARFWIENRKKGKEAYPLMGFPFRPGFAYAVTLALEKGDLTEEEKDILRDIASDVLANNNQEGSGVMNRSLGYVLMTKPLLKLIPNHPMREQLMKFPNAIMSDFMNTKEVLENSSNYLPLTAFYLIQFIDNNNLQPLYQEKELKNFFELILSLVDPSGAIPQFADYGGKRIYNPMIVAALERIAAVYKDGRYKWAAHQMMRNYLQNFDLKKVGGHDSFAMAFAALWADDSIAEVRPADGSVLLRRNTGHLEKMVLRSSYEPDAFCVLVDFINGCEHGDNNTFAVLGVCNNGGQSLLDKAGRDVGNHSVPLIRESKADFPYLQKPWAYGRWNHASFDLKLFWGWGDFSGGAGSPVAPQSLKPSNYIPYEFTYRPDKEFSLAWNFGGSGKLRVCLDNVKLVKTGVTPDKPEKELVLEDFEGGAFRWIGNYRRVEGGVNGKYCGSFDIDFSESGFIGKKFPMLLDVYGNEYDRIEYNFKFEPVDGGMLDRWFTLHVGDKTGNTRNFPSIHMQNYPVRENFFKENSGSTFAGFRIDNRDEMGSLQSIGREFFFAKNKFLWVRDLIIPAAGTPFAAGPEWQIGELTGVSGKDFYDTKIDTNLLVYFVPRPGSSVELISNPTPKGFESGYKKQYPALLANIAEGDRGGKELVFDTVLLPHDGKGDAKKLAEGIKVLYDKEGVTMLQVGEDWLLRNPSGRKVAANGIETDYQILFLERKNGNVIGAEGLNGTVVEIRDSQGKNQAVKVK